MQRDFWHASQLEIAKPDIKHLRDSGPGIIHQHNEESVAPALGSMRVRSDRAALEQDLLERVESYQQQFSVKVAQIEAPGLYKYYSTQRPVDIGTFPKPAGNEPDEIENYDKRVPVEGGAFLAWGHLTYTKPLTEKQAADYELRPAPEVSGLLREGRPRPIAEQMKEAARLAGERQAPAAPKRNAPDRGDR